MADVEVCGCEWHLCPNTEHAMGHFQHMGKCFAYFVQKLLSFKALFLVSSTEVCPYTASSRQPVP